MFLPVPVLPSPRFLLSLAAVIAAGAGCVAVRPWQREALSRPALVVPLAEPPLATGYRAKLIESKTGGGLPGSPAGGGCGCTQ
jgi:hypothetical protein